MKNKTKKQVDSIKNNDNLLLSNIIKSLTLEDITQIVGAFSDMNITEKMVREHIELNYL